MSSTGRSSKFYVVGGPVQPDRPCYVQRDADDSLLRRLLDAEYCHVMAQRHTGKTSMAAHTAWNLRDRDVRVAVVDLTQLLKNEQDEGSGRWYYSIAYRIVRDLRIKSDMQAWWADHAGLTNQQRLVEFFFEVVLSGSEHRYVVFVDRLEKLAGHPLGEEFLGAIRACYDARATEPEFQRLTFCLLGSGVPEEIVKNVQDSPFGITVPVPLGDFRRAEIDSLLAGLGNEGVHSEQVASRAWWWTRGHPYLTQKLFRGLARRSDEVLSGETVDEVVTSLFLSQASSPEESHLATIAERLLKQNSTRTTRLSLYGRIRKGGEVAFVKGSKPQRELLASGVVIVDQANMLVIRNAIYAEVFSPRWVNQSLPFGWKRLASAAAVLALLVTIPVWYTEYLPRPYERALTAASQDYQVAYEAYESLSMLPGYADRANALFSEFLARQSRRAETLPDALRTHQRMVQIPGAETAATGLLAEFWDRHANALAMRGERDGALLARLNALEVPDDTRRRSAAALIGDDYRQLLGTLRVSGKLQAVRVDQKASQLALLDDQHVLQLWQLKASQKASLIGSTELVAEERVQMQSRLIVSAPPDVKRMRVLIGTDHPRASDVSVSLRAPSGGAAVLSLADAVEKSGEYSFDSEDFPALQALLADDASGTWVASFSDTERGVTGSLLQWTIEIDQAIAESADESTIVAQIPEPVLTTLIQSALNSSGSLALTWPDQDDVSGDVLVWDVASAGVLTRIPRETGFTGAQFVLGGKAVMVTQGRRAELRDAVNGEVLGELVLPSNGIADAVLSDDGRYIVLNVEREDGTRGFETHDLKTLEVVGATISAENAGGVAVDSQGRYLAVADRDRLVRIWSLRDATLFREFSQANTAVQLSFDASGRWLSSQDARHTLRVWEVEGNNSYPVLERKGNEFWQMTFNTAADQLFAGSGGRSYELIGLPAGRVVGQAFRHPTMIPDNDYVSSRQVSLVSDQGIAVTHDGRHEVKLWQLTGVSQAPSGEQLSAAPVSQSAISLKGNHIALGSADGGVRVFPFDSDPGLIIAAGTTAFAEAHTSDVTVLEFNSEGLVLASGSAKGGIKLWNAETGVPLEFEARHQDGAIVDLQFSARGDVLVSASKELVVVTDVLTGERLAEHRIKGAIPQIGSLAADDKVLIAGPLSGVVLWNWREGTFEQLVGGDYKVRRTVAAGDDKLLVTASEDNSLLLWNAATREPIGEPVALPGRVDSLWAYAGRSEIYVRSGHWLQTYAVTPVGLLAGASVLLPERTATVNPNPDAGAAKVLVNASSSRPLVVEVVLDIAATEDSAAPLLEGDVTALQSEWQERLAYDDVFAAQAGTSK